MQIPFFCFWYAAIAWKRKLLLRKCTFCEINNWRIQTALKRCYFSIAYIRIVAQYFLLRFQTDFGIYYGWNLFMDIEIGKITLHFQMCVNTICRIDFRMQFNLTIICPNSICFSIMKPENFQLSSQKSFLSEVCVANGQKKGKSIHSISLLSIYALLSHPFLHIVQYLYLWGF